MIHQITRLRTLNSLEQVLRYTWVGFWHNRETRFITEIPNNYQWKENKIFYKMWLGFFKIALHLRDQHLFMWGMSTFKRRFLLLTFMVIFHKTTILFEELEKLFSYFLFFSKQQFHSLFRVFRNLQESATESNSLN